MDTFRRLLWWLVAVLLLLGVMSIAASTIVAGKVERWLESRGLSAQIDYLHVSVPRLSLLARGVQAENRDGRGFRARELLLDYSWWQLLRGRWKLQRVSLEGAYMDLESSAVERGRQWEIGGWALGQGPRRDRDLQLLFERVRIRDSRLCYRHRPAWPTPSCVRFGNLSARDFQLGMQRSGDEPLDLTIGAHKLGLGNLLIETRGSDFINTALVELALSEALYRRAPGNRITADSLAVRMFGSCPPQRWAEALPALGRLVGHCATARQLQLSGDLLFSFGRGAEVRWHRAGGREIALRHRDRRWQNWRAQTLAIDDFDYLRDRRRITWQRAAADGFDYCPGAWRNREHHYCVRAGSLQLPDPVRLGWGDGFNADAGPGRLQRTRLLDLAGDNRNPLTLHRTALGTLSYRGRERLLSIDGVDMESASGCVPGGLWNEPDYCARLAGLHSPETVEVRFASKAAQRSWGFASGPLKLAQLRLQRGSQPQFQLQRLHWQHIDLLGAGGPLLLQDFGLQSASGCVPQPLLPQRLRPLCADLRRLRGEGHFAWQGGDDSYLIFGDVQLQRLLLSDRPDSARGLLLERLAVGEGFYRRHSDGDNPWIDAGDIPADILPVTAGTGVAESAGEAADIGAEKGLLPEELARRRAAAADDNGDVPSVASPNLKLQRLSLDRLEGCLPAAWARLFYQDPQRMPGCFDFRNLQQRQPLLLAWQGGLDLAAAELTLERALARTPAGNPLLQLSGLQLPRARVRYLSASRRADFALPEFSLEGFYACLPRSIESAPLDIRCADLQQLQFSDAFALHIDSRGVSATLNGSSAQRILLTGAQEQFVADIVGLQAPQLDFHWPRDSGRRARLRVDGFSAEQFQACLPQTLKLRPGLPRCIATEKLRSTGGANDSGIALEETVLKSGPVAEPLWRIGSVRVSLLALTPRALQLHGLRLQQVSVCGLRQFLPPGVADSGIADCVRARDLNFAGTSRIGLAPSEPRLQLAALESEPISLWQASGEYLQLGLQRLSWRNLSWNGGALVRVTDLDLRGFRACLDISAQRCIDLGELRIRGTQTLSLAAPFSSDGAIELVGLRVGNPGGAPWEFSRMQLDQLAYGGDGVSAGSLSGLSGCLPAGWFGDTRLSPCYQLGAVRFGGIQRVDTPAGRVTRLRDFAIDGVQLVQADFPASAPAQLLQVKNLQARVLQFGAGVVEANGLELEDISGCLPGGYVPRLDHCVGVDKLSSNVFYRARARRLALRDIALQQLQVIGGEGRRLVRGEQVRIGNLWREPQGVGFDWLQADAFSLFGRRERAPEFDRHAWTGEFRQLRVEQLGYASKTRHLDIDSIELLRPRGVLVRDGEGNYPVGRHFERLVGEAPAGAENPRPFRYRVGDLVLDHGTFTWVDRQGHYRARLPVRRINLRLKNASNHPHHDPATVLFNARPGGFGELQLAGTLDYLDTRKWDANLTGYIRNTNLIPATPYMAQLLGYKILQGQLDAVLDIGIRSNEVKAHAKMVLNRIRVRRVRDSDQLPVSSTFIPLGIALELLKDGEGNVRFDMPVTGDLYDPQFSFSYIFSDLLQRAIMEALFSYFTPIGFYTLGKLAWARLRAVRFDPIEFEPGSVDLSEKARRQLMDVVEELRQRPDARPGICGTATALDWHALHPDRTPTMRRSRKARETFYRYPPIELHEELERLAQRRSRRVEFFLLREGISADEFIQCAPDYNGRNFDNPRVEFSH
ncbi:DUF748 domain-containing protein [Microbulbifer litoralis]|uniref:DUF748 domain-containing protein n=1 Tax=Microbulbifer litoralis TaxID=2933965 RepID=UPI0020278AFD|nr:DUF748 domain-containing protein [Microbulbifer sp. GX H0434]